MESKPEISVFSPEGEIRSLYSIKIIPGDAENNDKEEVMSAKTKLMISRNKLSAKGYKSRGMNMNRELSSNESIDSSVESLLSAPTSKYFVNNRYNMESHKQHSELESDVDDLPIDEWEGISREASQISDAIKSFSGEVLGRIIANFLGLDVNYSDLLEPLEGE